MDTNSPCQYFQVNMLDNDFHKCKNCGHPKSEHQMYKSPSIVASRASVFGKDLDQKIEEESKQDQPNSETKDQMESQSGVTRTSIGSVGDLAQKFGGQSRNSLSRRKSDITYKVND